MEEPDGKRCAHGARVACLNGHSRQHEDFVVEGAHISMFAGAGRMGDRRLLVLPSHNGKLVAPRHALVQA